MLKKIFFSGFFLLCTQLQCMDEPNIESSHLPKKKSEVESNKQHLANMLQSQGIDLSPYSSSVSCGGIIFEQTSLSSAWRSDGKGYGVIMLEEEYRKEDEKNIKSVFYQSYIT